MNVVVELTLFPATVDLILLRDLAGASAIGLAELARSRYGAGAGKFSRLVLVRPGCPGDMERRARMGFAAELTPAPGETAGLPWSPELTELLRAWAAGDHESRERLFAAVYEDLRRLASRRLRHEPGSAALETSDLLHDAFLRLVEQRHVVWQNRQQFFALAATFLRRVLVDHAKTRKRQKRGSGAVHVSLEGLDLAAPEGRVDLLALDAALTELAHVRATAAQVVELRFFAGLSVEETAAVMATSRATVLRTWSFARAFLALEMGAGP